tara:strand:- start:277 stop:693 length:417 start_codon:yes stop_codon:yes gene_type:complete
MSVFDYNLNRRQKLVKKGEAIDNNVDFSGRTNTDFTNKFVAKMRDTNNLYTRESPGQFDDQRAEVVRKQIINQADDMGQFNDPGQQVKSDAFLAKFRNSILVPPEEKPDRNTILQYVIGDPKGPPVNGQFPTDGVKTT